MQRGVALLIYSHCGRMRQMLGIVKKVELGTKRRAPGEGGDVRTGAVVVLRLRDVARMDF
jgi:hypothetical protein